MHQRRRRNTTVMGSTSIHSYNPWWWLVGLWLTKLCTKRHKDSELNDMKNIFNQESNSMILTGQQRHTILRTWSKMSSNLPGLGISLMNKVFENDYETKRLFELSDKSDSDIQKDRKFRQHACWLVQAVNTTMDNLDCLEGEVADMFADIGEKHASIPNFHARFFEMMTEVWASVWEKELGDRYSGHVHNSWERIFHFIISHNLTGYEEACTARLVALDLASNKRRLNSGVPVAIAMISGMVIDARSPGICPDSRPSDDSIQSDNSTSTSSGRSLVDGRVGSVVQSFPAPQTIKPLISLNKSSRAVTTIIVTHPSSSTCSGSAGEATSLRPAEAGAKGRQVSPPPHAKQAPRRSSDVTGKGKSDAAGWKPRKTSTKSEPGPEMGAGPTARPPCLRPSQATTPPSDQPTTTSEVPVVRTPDIKRSAAARPAISKNRQV